jgi:hypothetical protein
MNKFYTITLFGSTYGSNTYNSSTYGGSTQTSTGSNGSGGAGGLLANTGFDVLVAVTLACAIIFAALLVRLLKRKPSSKTD